MTDDLDQGMVGRVRAVIGQGFMHHDPTDKIARAAIAETLKICPMADLPDEWRRDGRNVYLCWQNAIGERLVTPHAFINGLWFALDGHGFEEDGFTGWIALNLSTGETE